MTDRPTIERVVQLQQLIADFASIARVPELADKKRPENDAEHSYGLALTVWFLSSRIAPELDEAKILKYALAHDTVELHAGDTFVFGDKAQLATKSDREDSAITQLEREWPDFIELTTYAKGYKNKIDEEARFVYAVDKLLPVMMVNLGEKQEFWSRHKISLEMMKKEKEPRIKQSKYLAPYYDAFLKWMTAPDYFYKKDSDTSQQG